MPTSLSHASLVTVLRERAAREPGAVVYSFIDSAEPHELTFGQLDAEARAIACVLQSSLQPGDRALVLHPGGRQFLPALLACFYAGVIAVPSVPLRRSRDSARLTTLSTDAGCAAALVATEDAPTYDAVLGPLGIRCIATNSIDAATADAWTPNEPRPDAIAFLQYTSGSTSRPRGVVLSHDNLVANLEAMGRAFLFNGETVSVSWLPLFHDMGLIEGALNPIYHGHRAYLMSPQTFLGTPLKWLEAISRYRATHTGAPNFAYDLCVRKTTPAERAALRLDSLRTVYNGAEPIRPATLQRFCEAFEPSGFRRAAFFPCFGLAEATLIVSGGPADAGPRTVAVDSVALQSGRQVVPQVEGARRQELVASGRLVAGTKARIVDPETRTEVPPGDIGEIWVSGPSVAMGYWRQPDATRETFDARIVSTGEGPFLKTGDLGFVYEDQLFVTGRMKDVLIFAGRNYYPQDVELVVEEACAIVRPGCSAAFSVEVGSREELVVVAEVRRDRDRQPEPQTSDSLDAAVVFKSIRAAVSLSLELRVHDVVLIEPGAIPKTSSGKLQRRLCRERYRQDALPVVARLLTAPAAGSARA